MLLCQFSKDRWRDANLVAKTLGGNDGDFIAKTLVGLEVERQLGVVTLNDDLGGLLDGLFNLKKSQLV